MIKKINYIAVNVLSSAIVFACSVLFLRILSAKDLGIIMLFQSVIALLGLAQIGLFNGGLRIFSVDSSHEQYQRVNNSIVTYILILLLLTIVLIISTNLFYRIDIKIYILSAIIGSFALLKNWFSNILIARRKLSYINTINIISSSISALLSLLVFKYGIYGALISIASTHVMFVILYFVLEKDYIPRAIELDLHSIKQSLLFGFVPYLSGIAALLNNQVDRIFIAKGISLEALGQFYLAFTFISVFDMLPGNLNSLFIPNALNSYNLHKIDETISIAKKYLLILIVYSLITSIGLFVLGEKVVSLLFPDKVGQFKYLIIMLPGIVALTISKSFSFVLYIALKLRAILYSNILSIVSYILMLSCLIFFNKFSIENISYVKSAQGFIILFVLVFSTIVNWKSINAPKIV